MSFEFATAPRIVFGCGTVSQLPLISATYGQRVLVVTGADPQRFAWLLESLTRQGLTIDVFSISGEPTVEDARKGAEQARQKSVQLVIGLGGGSAVDAGKAIAALATQPSDVMEYLEVVGKGMPLVELPLPYIAVPTTAGTGAEVTRNAVLSSPEHRVKASLRHVSMLPRVASIDPELARDCPPSVTAASGMDALTQCLEAFVSSKAQPMTDALCVDGIHRARRSLVKAVTEGQDLAAREDMALAAMFSGMALANAGLGAVHGFAAPIGGAFHAPHGAVCAALLAPVWAANWWAVQREGQPSAIAKFKAAAQWLCPETPEVEASVEFLQSLTRRLNIPGLTSYGIREAHLEDIAFKAAKASSMKGNPVILSQEELLHVLRQAL